MKHQSYHKIKHDINNNVIRTILCIINQIIHYSPILQWDQLLFILNFHKTTAW